MQSYTISREGFTEADPNDSYQKLSALDVLEGGFQKPNDCCEGACCPYKDAPFIEYSQRIKKKDKSLFKEKKFLCVYNAIISHIISITNFITFTPDKKPRNCTKHLCGTDSQTQYCGIYIDENFVCLSCVAEIWDSVELTSFATLLNTTIKTKQEVQVQILARGRIE